MRSLCYIALGLTLAACVTIDRPSGKRPIAGEGERTTSPAIGEAVTVSVLPSVPDLECSVKLSQDEELRRSVVEQMADAGDYYAALAQVETLPQRAASVGLLRADVLRQLNPGDAERWYRALLRTCLAGRAEHGLGLLAANRGQYAEALPRLQQAARTYPADPRIRNDLGVLYLYLRQDTQAQFELRTAHELAKEDAQPRFNLMLLALLQADRTGWQELQARWQPDAGTRAELLSACRRLQSQRLGRVQALQLACPLDPTEQAGA